MPVYEFKCRQCGHPFQEIRKIGDFNTVCPECGSADTEKMISSFASRGLKIKCSTSGGG